MTNINEVLSFVNEAKHRGIIMGLDNMRLIAERLGNPQNKPKNIIHIAGTNGKGSVGAFIESSLLDAGYTVGRYSSPAVFSYFEIFRKNGANITESEYCICMNMVKSAAHGINPTAFELETAAAFLFMSDCDYAIVETGLGGRLDATNIIDAPKLAVLTSISLDHTGILGNTVEEITAEKCGIITSASTIISVEQQAHSILEKYPAKFAPTPENIRFMRTYQLFDISGMTDIRINMLGRFQPTNASLAIAVLHALGIDESHIRNGLQSASWHGRFDIISADPLIIADGAHNQSAFEELRKTLDEYFPNEKFTFLTGVFKDKDYAYAAKLFAPLAHKVYTITPDNPRALDNTEYAEKFKQHGAYAEAVTIEDAVRRINKNTITVAFGSLSFMKRLYDEVNNGKS